MDKYEEAIIATQDLSLHEKKCLVESLDSHIAEWDFETKGLRHWTDSCFFVISPIWFVILAIGGLLDLEPVWLRAALFPVLGIPAGVLYILGLKQRKWTRKLDFYYYCVLIFFLGPVYSVLSGLILCFIFYFPLKWFGFLH